MLDWQLGVQEIATDVDQQGLRDGPEFSALESEINKLVDIHAAAPTDWDLVADLASKILANQGKDLSVAVWLVAAWVQTNHAEGLAAGMHVLRDLHEQYWDTMLPPAKRIRGRRNQMDWLLDTLDKSFQDTESWPPITDEQYQGLQLDWDFVDDFWQEKDDQPPSFFKLRKYIDALAVQSADDPSESDAQDIVDEAEPANDALVADTVEQNDAPTIQQAPETKPAQDLKNAVDAENTNKQSVPSTESLDLPTANDLDNQLAIENYIEQALAEIQKPLPDISDDLLYTPLMYRFNRQCSWLVIDQLPHANESITAIPAPMPTDQDSLQSLIESNDVNAILRFCEAKLPVYRFWLDLNYAAYQAASSQTESADVANTILQETAYFVARMPGLIDLCFNDEKPFANNDTKQWLINNLDNKDIDHNNQTTINKQQTKTIEKPHLKSGLVAAPLTEDTITYTTTLAVASAETRAALNLLEVVANRLQSAADSINGNK